MCSGKNFHIGARGRAAGQVVPCTAKNGCTLKGDAPHFDTKEEGLKWIADHAKENNGLFKVLKKNDNDVLGKNSLVEKKEDKAERVNLSRKFVDEMSKSDFNSAAFSLNIDEIEDDVFKKSLKRYRDSAEKMDPDEVWASRRELSFVLENTLHSNGDDSFDIVGNDTHSIIHDYTL